jgi:hypothetical protein
MSPSPRGLGPRKGSNLSKGMLQRAVVVGDIVASAHMQEEVDKVL